MKRKMNSRLAAISSWGVKLFVGNVLSTPEAVFERLLRTDETCIQDFVYDQNGKLCEVHYNFSCNR